MGIKYLSCFFEILDSVRHKQRDLHTNLLILEQEEPRLSCTLFLLLMHSTTQHKESGWDKGKGVDYFYCQKHFGDFLSRSHCG